MTPGCSGSRSRTKSRSGVSVYRQVFVRAAGPERAGHAPGQEALDPAEAVDVDVERPRPAAVVGRPPTSSPTFGPGPRYVGKP